MLNLDTHILIHALQGQLRPLEQDLLQRDSWGISTIVLWEISKLAQLGRIEVDLEDAAVVRALSKLHQWPITIDICRALSKLDFSSDPADELIAATSVVHDAPLVTRDRRILCSKMVPFPGDLSSD